MKGIWGGGNKKDASNEKHPPNSVEQKLKNMQEEVELEKQAKRELASKYQETLNFIHDEFAAKERLLIEKIKKYEPDFVPTSISKPPPSSNGTSTTATNQENSKLTAEKDKEFEKFKQQNEQLQKDLNSERQNVKSLQSRAHELEIEHKQLVSENRTFSQTSSLIQQEKDELEKKISDLESNFETAKDKLSQAEEQNFALTTQLERAKDEIRFIQQTSKHTNIGSNNQINSGHGMTSLISLHSQNSSPTDELEVSRHQNGNLLQSDQFLTESGRTSVLESNDGDKNLFEKLSMEKADLTDKFLHLAAKLKQFEEREEKEGDLRNAFEKVKKNLETLQQTNTQLEKKMNEQTNNASKIQSELRNEIQELQTQLTNTQTNENNERNELTQLGSKFQNQEQDLSRSKQSLLHTQQELSDLRTKYETLQSENELHIKQKEHLNNEFETAQTDLSSRMNEILKLRDELLSLTEKKELAITELVQRIERQQQELTLSNTMVISQKQQIDQLNTELNETQQRLKDQTEMTVSIQNEKQQQYNQLTTELQNTQSAATKIQNELENSLLEMTTKFKNRETKLQEISNLSFETRKSIESLTQAHIQDETDDVYVSFFRYVIYAINTTLQQKQAEQNRFVHEVSELNEQIMKYTEKLRDVHQTNTTLETHLQEANQKLTICVKELTDVKAVWNDFKTPLSTKLGEIAPKVVLDENSQTWTDFMRKVLTVYTEQTDERFKKQQLDNQRLSVELTELKKVHLDLPYLKNMFINYVTHAEDREKLVPVLASILRFTETDWKILKEKEDFKHRKASLGQPQSTNTPPRSSTPANLSTSNSTSASNLQQHKRSASSAPTTTTTTSSPRTPVRTNGASSNPSALSTPNTTSKTVPNTPTKQTKT